jgi:hypothetical protein
MRILMATAVAVAALFAAGCSAGPGHTALSLTPLSPDPRSASALLKIATRFNHEYGQA